MSVPATSLRRNAAWTVVGNLVYAACQLGMLTLLAKLGSAAEVGRFALALAAATPVISLCTLQLRNLQATDSTDRVAFGDYLGLRLVGMLVALVAIVFAAIAGYAGETTVTIIVVGIAKAVEAISDIAFGLLQRHERMRTIALSQIVKGLLALAAVAIGMLLGGGAVWCGVALAVAWTLSLVLVDIPAAAALVGGVRGLRPHLSHARLARLAWLALPLGGALAMLTLLSSLPRLALERYASLPDVGIFAALMTLILPGTLVIGALAQAVSPRLAHAYARQDKKQVRRLVEIMLAAAVVVGAGGLLVVLVAGEWVLRLLYSAEIAAGATHLPLIMIGGAAWCVCSVLGYTAVATRRLRMQPIATAVALIATLVSVYALVPTGGLEGAVHSSLVSALVMMPLLVIVNLLKSDAAASETRVSGVV